MGRVASVYALHECHDGKRWRCGIAFQLQAPGLLKRGVSLINNGRWKPATSVAHSVHNPAIVRPSTALSDATTIAEVPDMNADDVKHETVATRRASHDVTTL